MNDVPRDHALRELRLARALGDLTPEQEAELRRLEGDGERGPDEYELAASAVYLAFRSSELGMPTRLRRVLEEEALEILGSKPH